MRNYFLQLFLSFWIATVGILVCASIIFPDNSAENQSAMVAASARTLTAYAVKQYHTQGCEGLVALGEGLTLADSSGHLLCSAPPDETSQPLIDMTRKSHHPIERIVGSDWIRADAEELAPGEFWFLVQRTAYKHRLLSPVRLMAIPISFVVMVGFAYIFTRPVRALSKAFRTFAAGDLNVRLPVLRRRWHVVGGADIRTLMVDFNDMAERIQELVEAQNLLIRDISHELRSPLARLGVALELVRVKSDCDSPHLNRVQKEVDRMQALISEMLMLSVMESTREMPSRQTFVIAELLDDLLPDMIFEAEAKGCRVLYKESDAEIRIAGAQPLLRRALENIIRNAIRYTPANQPIEIDVSSLVPGQWSSCTEELVITVSDRGPGVPKESLTEILRPFYRVDMSRQGSTGGFGVGLAIAERAVQLHSGHIEVTNRDGGGLVVQVVLPCSTGISSPRRSIVTI